MPQAVPIDATSTESRDFQRILTRNVALPLAAGLVGAVLFVFLIYYLLGTIGKVEHTDQVLRRAAILQKLTVDKETSMRGFLIAGEEAFLGPYQIAVPQLKAESESIRPLVADNPNQTEILHRIDALQAEWD